jgi:hypothetical protein
LMTPTLSYRTGVPGAAKPAIHSTPSGRTAALGAVRAAAIVVLVEEALAGADDLVDELHADTPMTAANNSAMPTRRGRG